MVPFFFGGGGYPLCAADISVDFQQRLILEEKFNLFSLMARVQFAVLSVYLVL